MTTMRSRTVKAPNCQVQLPGSPPAARIFERQDPLAEPSIAQAWPVSPHMQWPDAAKNGRFDQQDHNSLCS